MPEWNDNRYLIFLKLNMQMADYIIYDKRAANYQIGQIDCRLGRVLYKIVPSWSYRSYPLLTKYFFQKAKSPKL